MPPKLPSATIRTQVTLPLRFADGYATTARVFTFNGLADGREHVAFGLGDRSGVFTPGTNHGPPPLVRPHSECLTGTSSAASDATAARNCGSRSS